VRSCSIVVVVAANSIGESVITAAGIVVDSAANLPSQSTKESIGS